MTQKEYENKKRECWEEYVNLLNHNSAARYVFDKIFDRAYALGREKETITQEEIKKLAKEFAELKTVKQAGSSAEVERKALLMTQFFHFAMDRLPIGKQEKDADTVIIDKEEYYNLCKYRRYAANWVPNLAICPICGEYNPSGCVCANCDNDKNWNNGE